MELNRNPENYFADVEQAAFNPANGTLAELREFENALTSVGDMVLSQVMGRGRSVGGWSIVLAGNPTAFQNSGGINLGLILENGGLNAPSGPGVFPPANTRRHSFVPNPAD